MYRLEQDRKTKVILDGYDISDYFVSASGNFDTFDYSKGLFIASGTVVLSRPDGLSTNYLGFDDRFSTDFKRGKEFKIGYSNNLFPVIGTSYIVSTSYDLVNTLTVSVTCALGLNNFVGNGNLGFCVDYGEKTPVSEIITTLLVGAGIPSPTIGSLQALEEFYIQEPFSLDQGKSLIQTAGQLAAQYGFFLYQDRNGIVKLRSILAKANYNHVLGDTDLYVYQRFGSNETIINRLNGVIDKVEVVSDLGVTQDALTRGDITLKSRKIIDKSNLKVTIVVEDYRKDSGGLPVLFQTETVEKSFELGYAVARNKDLVDVNLCFPEQNTRILKETRSRTSTNLELVRSWLSHKASAGFPSSFSISGTFTSSVVETSYEYTSEGVTVIQDFKEAIAIAIPVLGDLTLGRPSAAPITDVDPLTLATSKLVVTQYTALNERSDIYTQVINVYENKYRSPDLLSSQIKDVSRSLVDIAKDIRDLKLVSSEVNYGVSLPAFESFSNKTETITKQTTVSAGVITSPSDNTEDIFLGRYGNFNPETLQELVLELLQLRNGRVFGMQVAFPLVGLEEGDWGSFVPLAYGKAQEPNDYNLSSSFRMDSPGIEIQQDRAILNYNGVFIGFSSNPLNTNLTDDLLTLTPPVNLPPTGIDFSLVWDKPVQYELYDRNSFTVV